MNACVPGVIVGSALVLILAAAGQVAAEPDDVHQARLEQDPPSPRWENVAGPPRWVAGESPSKSVPGGLRGVRLEPGDAITIRVAAGERLRAQGADGVLREADLEFRWSNGTGLSVVASAVASADGTSLIAAPPVRGDSLVTVARPARAATGIRVALFVSSYMDAPGVARYRDQLVPVSAGPRLRVEDRRGSVDYWTLDPRTPLTVDVSGPMRIAVRSLLPFGAEDAPLSQSYRIYSYLDGRLWHTQDAATRLDTASAKEVDGCRQLTGLPVTGYLDVPPGAHRLELHSWRPLYVRLLAGVGPEDYLFAPNEVTTREVPATRDTAPGTGQGFWSLSNAELRSLQGDMGRPSALTYRTAARVAEDNGRRHGGLAGAMAVAGWREAYPAEQAYRRLASRRYQLHTFYRDLVPETLGIDGSLVYARFVTPTIADGEDTAVWIPEAYSERMAAALAGGYFFPVGNAATKAQSFLLPDRGAPSLLRIGVNLSGTSPEGALFLQYDHHTPQQFWFDPAAVIPPESVRPNALAAALPVAEKRFGLSGAALAGMPGEDTDPAPLVSVAYLEIPLPHDVRQVRLWRQAAQGAGELRAALAYRDSRPFLLAEDGFLAVAAKVGSEAGYRLFRASLMNAPNRERELPPAALHEADGANVELRDAYFDLFNQWVPLLRFLHARKEQFETGVASVLGDAPGATLLDRSAREELQRRAKAAQAEGDWLQALERWSALWYGSTGGVRERARQGQIGALEQLGNAFLAGQLLRHDFLHGDSEALRRYAFERLLERARDSGDSDGQVGLLVAAVSRWSDARLLKMLAEALLDSGRSRYALMVMMALPPQERSPRLLVEAAYLEGWWGLFEDQRRRLDKDGQRLWAGYRAQHRGDYAGAREHWQQAGKAGDALVAYLDEGLVIRDELAAKRPDRRVKALERWAAWQAAAPGRRVWRPLSQATAEVEETELLYVPGQDLQLKVARAGPDLPVTTTVYGPAVLRFQVRPLHGAGEEQLDDWVLLTDRGKRSFYPVIDNRPAAGLELLGRGGTRAGRAIDLVYEVPAGYHALELRTELGPAVVETDVLRPAVPFTLLPALNPYSARAALAGELHAAGQESSSLFGWRTVDRWLNGCGPKVREVTGKAGPLVQPEGARVLETPSPEWFAGVPDNSVNGAAGHVLHGFRPVGLPSDGAGGSAVTRRLTQLLWNATHDDNSYAGALAEAERLFRDNPTVAGAEPILRRLRRGAKWEQVEGLVGGVGVRLVEIGGWQPESPELRLRKALMQPLLPGEQIMAGDDVLAFAVDQSTESEFVIRLKMEDVALQPAHDMTVQVALDDDSSRHVDLTPEEPFRGFIQRISAGSHVVRLWIQEPLAGQYLRVRVLEGPEENAAPVTESHQRIYHLAAPDEPLTVDVEGPALLRIHEWRDGDQVVRYQPVDPGWQRVTIRAAPGRKESLYRVYRQKPDPQRRVAAFRPSGRRAVEVPPPHWTSLPTSALKDFLPDALPFIGPQDGTWSFVGSLVSRRVVEDEPSEQDEAEEFAQAEITYRRFAEDQETYYRWGGLIREREHGNPTFGLNGLVSIQKSDWPVDVDLYGSLFVQHLDQTGDLESATRLQVRVSDQRYWGPKTYHRPFVSAFKRWLTLRDYPAQHPEEVDQDVFTQYKADHDQGLKLGDLGVYRPWIDTLVYGGGTLASNAELNPLDPDHTRVRLGAKQLFGDIAVGVDYSWYHYFEDDDRDESGDTQRLRVDVESVGWWSPNNGWMGNVRYEYDQDSGHSAFWLSLGWNHAHGRYFSDFRPGETDFIPLRQQRALEKTGEFPGK